MYDTCKVCGIADRHVDVFADKYDRRRRRWSYLLAHRQCIEQQQLTMMGLWR